MATSTCLEQFFSYHHVEYQVVKHPKSASSFGAAHAAHIPAKSIIKSVVLEDEDGYLLAILPATRRVEVGKLSKLVGRRFGLATEPELARLFTDCELGAAPPLGRAYGVDTIWDDSIMHMPDVYFEAGDHEGLVHMSNAQFQRLVQSHRHGNFSRPLSRCR